jgi:phage host-nuclease inhibitor protein Gam
VRLDGPALQTWADVDDSLKEIVQCDLQVERFEGEYNEAVTQFKDQVTAHVKPIQEKRDTLGRLVKEFCEEHKPEMVGKSRELNFGRVGFRLSTSMVIKNAKAIIALLKAKRLFNCVVSKESVSKDELKKLDDDTLAELGVSKRVEDVFWYETKRDQVREV